MPHEYLSEDQIARYGRFPDKLSVTDLEQCFRLTPDALTLAASKRTPATQLGWAVQWGTVRILGIFQADHPTRVPERAVAFVADQLDVDPGVLPDYRAREKTAYEHAWQIATPSATASSPPVRRTCASTSRPGSGPARKDPARCSTGPCSI